MGKLILGIIAVILLQIVFFAYMATERPDRTVTENKRTVSQEKARVVGRSSGVGEPATLPEPTVSAATGRPSPKLKHKPSTPPLVTAARDRQRTSKRSRREHRPAAATVAKSVTVSEEWNPKPSRVRSVIPSGHTMVLVDYSPAIARQETREIKKKKRSYLARAFPALVKKPWNWIKSLASKLD